MHTQKDFQLDFAKKNRGEMKELKELHDETGQLTRLRLDLSGCSEIVLIPPNVSSSLKRLEDLRLGINSIDQWEGGRSNRRKK
ncbi:disease resistance protein [Pyrus ussuriensis x Pyrus communis]|uniref:Disease resistance protein n=1 Tax=Pyrus ussuriensis x Pyrus communis TaxID=2448454 RepID=A0A5N5GAF5_9ROSA|nr:disease resistance protein [Pyrus ussuriensis x Pyrus communis]